MILNISQLMEIHNLFPSLFAFFKNFLESACELISINRFCQLMHVRKAKTQFSLPFQKIDTDQIYYLQSQLLACHLCAIFHKCLKTILYMIAGIDRFVQKPKKKCRIAIFIEQSQCTHFDSVRHELICGFRLVWTFVFTVKKS